MKGYFYYPNGISTQAARQSVNIRNNDFNLTSMKNEFYDSILYQQKWFYMLLAFNIYCPITSLPVFMYFRCMEDNLFNGKHFDTPIVKQHFTKNHSLRSALKWVVLLIWKMLKTHEKKVLCNKFYTWLSISISENVLCLNIMQIA